jgi:acetyl-CoA acetyltransferase family protein
MANLAKQLVFVAAKRTAFGTMQGALSHLSATDLAVLAARSALEQSGLRPDEIDQTIVGNVIQTSSDAIYLARHVGLRSGVPADRTALTVNRLCGSGFQAIVSGAEQLLLDEAQVVMVGGTESMSQAPHVLRGARNGWALGKAPPVSDILWESLTDSFVAKPMGMTAEDLGAHYAVTREMCDLFALESQQRWAAASAAGRFVAEIAPVELKARKGTSWFTVDEHPRVSTTLESLAKLPPVFKKDGLVTAGNASGICDGAAMLILTSEQFARSRGLRPLARLLQWSTVGVDPSLMGIGPAPAIRRCLERASLTLSDIDLIEVNEAFAPQFLSVEKELSLERSKTNVDGGAIALGHPLAASGARIMSHLIYEASRRAARYAIGSACIGGGQGMALLLQPIV